MVQTFEKGVHIRHMTLEGSLNLFPCPREQLPSVIPDFFAILFVAVHAV